MDLWLVWENSLVLVVQMFRLTAICEHAECNVALCICIYIYIYIYWALSLLPHTLFLETHPKQTKTFAAPVAVH